MEFSVAAKSIIGRIRKNNEDNFFVDGEYLSLSHGDSATVCKTLRDDLPRVVGIFDGMGGYSGGENASFLAASAVNQYMEELIQEPNHAKVLKEFCMKANDIVCDAADGSPMGTTCALLCLNGAQYTICNVGDSPIFLVRDGRMKQISVDHNQKAIFEKVTGKSARPDQKFKLTQYIGVPTEEMLIDPFTSVGKLHDKDVFLLCSDGVTDMLSAEAIQKLIMEARTSEEIVSSLTEKAMTAGGRDNITAVCVKVKHSTGLPKSINGFLKWFIG